MKTIRALIGIPLVFALFSCSDDTTCVCPCNTPSIVGSVRFADSKVAAEAAGVYLSCYEAVKDGPCTGGRVYTNGDGEFRFSPVWGGRYRLYAGMLDGAGDYPFSHVSPISDVIDHNGQECVFLDPVSLYEVTNESILAGSVIYAESGLVADSTEVRLCRLEGTSHTAVDTTMTSAEGEYMFTNVKTGNYYVYAWRHDPDVPQQVLLAESDMLFCDGETGYRVVTLELAEPSPVVRKPAIYIYPDEDRRFEVSLGLHNGTILTESVPEYHTGWNVFVERSGRIDGRYDYLFYEASLGTIPELLSGWCIAAEDLALELPRLLVRIGLNEKETDDFLAYWGEVLVGHEFYSIHPVLNHSLSDMVTLQVDPKPDAILRFWLFFEGHGEHRLLREPQIPEFRRGMTTVIEWGGVLLN